MTENSVPKGDSKKAVAFLRWFCGGENRVIQSIHPETKAIRAYTFTKDEDDKLFEQIERLQGVESVYFQVNPLKAPINGARKATKTDVREIRWLQVDKDPVPKRDHEEERKRIFQVLPNYKTKPNLIIDSGGGGQAFWKLQTPIELVERTDGQEPWAEGEAYSQQLALELTADPCFNCDRIMRLPFTTNMPDAKKRAKGRVPALASVIYRDEGSYPLSAFAKALPVRTNHIADTNQSTSSARAIKLSDNIKRLTIEEVQQIATERGHPLRDDTCMLIVQGHDPDRPEYYKDRSKAVFRVSIEMVKAGLTPDEIAAVITDPSFGISAHVLDQKRPMKYAARQVRRAQEYLIDPDLAALNDDHAVVVDSNRVLVTYKKYDETINSHILGTMPTEEFKKLYENRKRVFKDENGKDKSIPLAKWWLEHPQRRFYEGMAYAPAGTESSILNLWEGFAYEPAQGQWSYMRELMTDVIADGNADDADYLMNWAAYCVQRLDTIPQVAITLRGERGVGKSTFGNTFTKLFGRHGLSVRTTDPVIGRFNGHLRHLSCLFIDEMNWKDDPRAEGILKGLITEPTIPIEGKGRDTVNARNNLRVIISTNDDWAVPVRSGERRFAVFNVSSRRKGDAVFFDALHAEQLNGGMAAMLHDLLQRDIAGWRPSPPPVNKAMNDQKYLSLKPEAQWWFHALTVGQIPNSGSPSPNTCFTRNLCKHMRSTVPALRDNSDPSLVKFCKDFGATNFSDGNARGWTFPNLSLARRVWEETYGPVAWDKTITHWSTALIEGNDHYGGSDTPY